MSMSVDERLWTVLSLSNDLFAVPADDVHAMVMLSAVSEVPNTPDYVRGMFVLRDRAVPVIDLRARLGMETLERETRELIELLNARERDHMNWLAELESSVKERRLFELTTDPHECAFGKWYDTYETDNLLLQSLLRKFDAPHSRIHGIAHEVVALEQAGDLEGAQALIDRTRSGDLTDMVRLFESLREQIRESLREIAVVLTVGEHTFAVAVDGVETVSVLDNSTDESINDAALGAEVDGLVTAIGRLQKSDRLVITLDPAQILGV